jgi:hypothetical protein
VTGKLRDKMEFPPSGRIMEPFNAGADSAAGTALAQIRKETFEAWQTHIERVREQLESGWREPLQAIFEQSFAELEQKVSADAAQSRREFVESLNNLARRIRSAEDRAEAVRTLLDGAAEYCRTAAVLSVIPGGLRFEGARGSHAQHGRAEPGAEIPFDTAPAFSNAVESQDTVVAAGTSRELSPEISSLLADPPGTRVYLFPMLLQGEVTGVLCAQGADQDAAVSALELLAALVAPSFSAGRQKEPEAAAAGLISIAGAISKPAVPFRPSWSHLSREEQATHLRAQRFARTRVASLVLNKIVQVREGRTSKNLYEIFREEIDAARTEFRREFFESCRSMVDYLHLELVRTLAKEDAHALGPAYPGPLL